MNPDSAIQNSSGNTSRSLTFSLSRIVSSLLKVRWCSPRSMRCRVVWEMPTFLAKSAYERLPRALRRNRASWRSRCRCTGQGWQNCHPVCVMIFVYN